MPNDQDLSDVVIQEAINNAAEYVGYIALYSRASSDIVLTATLNYAAFNAYQSYSDRVLNLISGTLATDGIYTPEGEVIQREVRNKLDDLRNSADRTLNMLRAFGSMSTLVRPGYLI